MALGILESRHEASPIGTSLLESLGSDRKAQVILVPKPSSSPNDPLNWSTTRKELFFLTIVLGCCAVGVIGPVLTPAFTTIVEAFEVTLSTAVLLNGVLVLGLGVSSYLCTALAPIYGKRIIFLSTTTLLLVSCIWAAVAKTFSSLLASRVFQGLGMGGFFALAGTISINDVFFVHQRGLRVGLWNLASIASISIAPIISGYVISDLGWRWAFWLLAITFGVVLFFSIFFFPETSFNRMVLSAYAESVTSNTDHQSGAEHMAPGEKQQAENPARYQDRELSETGLEQPRVWNESLGLNGFKIQNQYRALRNLVTPFFLLRAPVVLWACAMWSVVFSWLIIQSAVAQQIFSAPPYNMDSIHVGIFIGVAPLIGSVLGTVLGGYLSDLSSKWMSIKNNGVYEPEFRLLIMLPFLFTWILGSFGLGSALDAELSSTVCGVFLAILGFAVGIGCTGIVSYSNDVCQHCPGESFGIAMLIKSAFAFGLTFMLNDYYANHGPRVFMFTWGGLTAAVTLTTLPLYIYGKKARSWCSRNGILMR